MRAVNEKFCRSVVVWIEMWIGARAQMESRVRQKFRCVTIVPRCVRQL